MDIFYSGLEILTVGEVRTKRQNKIILCAYEINCEGLFPFVSYLLIKENENLVFPSFTLPKNCDSISSFIESSIVDLLKKVLVEDISKMEYDGYLNFHGKIYVFYDLSECKITIPNMVSTLWFGILDEIVNQRRICHMEVNTNVIDLFLHNSNLLFLKDKNNTNYEIPTVAYVERDVCCLNFTSVFGVLSDENGNYCFTSYENAKKKLSKKKGSGVVRFALFLKNNLEEYNIITVRDDLTIRNYDQQVPLSYHIFEKE